MKQPSIHRQALQVILLPITGFGFLLCFALIYLHLDYTDTFINQHGKAQIKQWAKTIEAITPLNQQLVAGLFEIAREEPDMRALSISSASGKELLHLGPQFTINLESLPSLPINSLKTLHAQPQTYSSGDSLLFQMSLHDGSILSLELSKLPYLILDYKIILTALLLWLLFSVVAFALATRCSSNMVNSLQQLRQNINRIRDGNLESVVEAEYSLLEVGEMVESIEKMRDNLLATQQDNRLHINQSTLDLRETLDTIEVQNIELNIARKKALEASRVKSEFLANTSHEFRTPLNGIIGFAQLTLRTDLNDQQQTYLRTILESSQNLLTSINDILDFSKLETGQIALEYAPLNVRQCIEETLQILAPLAHEKKLELITLVDQDLPKQLLGDALRLKQIISNLVSNGIKFSDHGNIIIRVQLLSNTDNQAEMKISIEDSGVGISAEQQIDIFSPFTQADTSNSREHNGAGLGLSISKGLIDRMNGDIWVNSELGKGSTFGVTFKLNIDRKNDPEQKFSAIKNKNILIFSRNSIATLQIKDLLNQHELETQSSDVIDRLLPSIGDANNNGNPYHLLIIDSSHDFSTRDYQLLKKVIWQARQRYQCRVIVIATIEQRMLISDETLEKLLGFCAKPLISRDLSLQLFKQLDMTSAIAATKPENKLKKPDAFPARILVVDDNPANLQLASELLKGIGATVHTASNGSEALQQVQQQEKGSDFDLIFMDVQMPVMDGIETTQEIRKKEKTGQRIPIIALTAHAMNDQKTKLLLAGMDDYLQKPVSEFQLQHAINRWCKKKDIDHSAEKKLSKNIDTPQKNNSTLEDTSPSHEQNTLHGTVVDRQQCLRLANQKPDLACDMLTQLIQSLKDDTPSFTQLQQRNQYDLLAERIHKLYGSCCYSGVPNLKEISGKLDKLLQQQDYQSLDIPMQDLEQAITELLDWQNEFDIEALFETE